MKFHENCPFGAKLFHVVRWTDGWTDMLKLIVAFLHFANMQRDWEFTYRLQACK